MSVVATYDLGPGDDTPDLFLYRYEEFLPDGPGTRDPSGRWYLTVREYHQHILPYIELDLEVYGGRLGKNDRERRMLRLIREVSCDMIGHPIGVLPFGIHAEVGRRRGTSNFPSKKVVRETGYGRRVEDL